MYSLWREKAFNPATKKLFEYGLIGLVIASVLIVTVQVRPQSVFPSQGILQISITDSPPGQDPSNHGPGLSCHGNCTATSLNLTISSIEVHTSGIDNMTGDWTPVCLGQLPMTIDLVRLQGTAKLVCGQSFQPETITNIRLNVTSVIAQLPQGTVTLSVPSGKLEIPLGPTINIQAGKTATITVDFQPHIVCQGNGDCKLTPVLHATPLTSG